MSPLRAVLFLSLIPLSHASAQARTEAALLDLAVRLSSITAVTGYEQAMVDTLLRLLPGARRDRAGNAVLTLGRGRPKRLLACPVDEPGYVVGNVREDGYLTLRRVPGQVLTPLFDQQVEGQRVTIQGRQGPVPGVVAVRSIHLTRGRAPVSDAPFNVDDAFVDVGASGRAEAEGLGISVLAPVTLTKRPHRYGNGLLASPMAGRRAACAALMTVARGWIAGRSPRGSVTVAFVVEQQLGQRGLGTLANERGPFESTLLADGWPRMDGLETLEHDADLAQRWPALGTVWRLRLPTRYSGTPVETVSLQQTHALWARVESWSNR